MVWRRKGDGVGWSGGGSHWCQRGGWGTGVEAGARDNIAALQHWLNGAAAEARAPEEHGATNNEDPAVMQLGQRRGVCGGASDKDDGPIPLEVRWWRRP